MKLLVTGGAGYIGSVVAAKLVAAGHQVTVLDDLSTGFADAIPAGAAFIQGTLRADAKAALGDGTDAVLHFAAHSQVGESVANPAKYWSNNLGGTLALLDAMHIAGTGRLVFSSTAAVYGEPEQVPIPETAPTRPASPYGASKLAVDTALAEYARLHGLAAVSLRYFNVAGAFRAADGTWAGERHDPESHLIPNVLRIASRAGAGGNQESVSLYGDDYPTPDGTCVRDYIHVNDLAEAHVLALHHLESGEPSLALNLGTGRGHSVLEILKAVEKITGSKVNCVQGPRRPGDPPALVADPTRAQQLLKWVATRSLDDIVATAWKWMQHSQAMV